ncbi:MAG: GtrA family protein [Lawsonibacter sp.]|nr:GtrA family protein [Lawsonibacter sp.]
MRSTLKKILDPTMFRFFLVGIVNTLVGMSTMFGLYNLAGLYRWGEAGYWISSAANYMAGSVVSFFLNKRFTFRNRERGWGVVLRFAVNIAVCYLLAYGLARPAAAWVLGGLGLSSQLQGNLTMLAGSGLFVVMNYLGQRFFAFRTRQS